MVRCYGVRILRVNTVHDEFCLTSRDNDSRLSLSRIPRDSLKYFEISVLRHIRFAELSKNLFD